MADVPAPSQPSLHDERLRVPWSWWPVIGLIVVIGLFEVGSGFDWHVLVIVACFMVGFFVIPLVISGRVRVQVRDGELQAGSHVVPVAQLTSIQALDREQTRMRLGPQADPACRMVVRGWIGPSVMVRLSNPHPVPYWVVSSRHPDRLVDALKTSRAEARAVSR